MCMSVHLELSRPKEDVTVADHYHNISFDHGKESDKELLEEDRRDHAFESSGLAMPVLSWLRTRTSLTEDEFRRRGLII